MIKSVINNLFADLLNSSLSSDKVIKIGAK